jgi:aldose 1-epimerase
VAVGAPIDGFQTRTIGSQRLQATFVPAAGMLCCSLRHEGEELLAQRDGVRAYAERGATMGIPLLYPWANRLAGASYPGPHGDVVLVAGDPLLKFDANGLPIHGAIPGSLPWELLDGGAAAGERLRARLRWERSDLLAIFPFAHVLDLRARIVGATLTIETSVVAPRDAPVPVPVSFGYHPYLTIPGTDRGEWQVELPADRRLLLDERMIPTGVSERFEHHRFQLAAGGWDDAFAGLEPPASFTAAAGGLQIELQFLEGYSCAQVYSPVGEPFVCFEPMTAPANALISRDGLAVVAPGETFGAAFSVSATKTREGSAV